MEVIKLPEDTPYNIGDNPHENRMWEIMTKVKRDDGSFVCEVKRVKAPTRSKYKTRLRDCGHGFR